MTQAINDSWDDPAKVNATLTNDPVARYRRVLREEVLALNRWAISLRRAPMNPKDAVPGVLLEDVLALIDKGNGG